MARILILHGASSAGKTMLAHNVLEMLEAPMWHLSIDLLRDARIWRMEAFSGGGADWSKYRDRYFSGFHATIAAAAMAGNDLLVEHIFDTPGWHSDLQAMLAQHEVFFVGIFTAEEILAQREQERGDRPAGSAVADARRVHRGLTYDLTLDGTAPASRNMSLLIEAWAVHEGPSAFFRAARS